MIEQQRKKKIVDKTNYTASIVFVQYLQMWKKSRKNNDFIQNGKKS